MIACFMILEDRRIRRYFKLGSEVKGLGRGPFKRMKESVREAKGLPT